MKKFFVFLIIIAGCLFLLYKTGNLSVDAIKAQFVSEEINNNSIGGTAKQAVDSQKSFMPEVSMQTYVAMKGLANAIDGK